jgi:hypothetical protein
VDTITTALGNRPILVYGMRRSGTTWIGKLFDSHPNTLYRHEPDSLIPMQDVPYYPELQDASEYETAIEQFFVELGKMTDPHVVAKMPVFPKNYLHSAVQQRYRLSCYKSKVFNRFLSLRLPVYNVMKASGSQNARLVWKSVESPCRVGVLACALPQSRVIYILRHPCGYLNSYLRGQQSGKMPQSSDEDYDVGIWEWRLKCKEAKKYDLDSDAVRGMDWKTRMVWEWIIDNERSTNQIAVQENAMVVVFDELCANPIDGTRNLFSHAGLEWHGQTSQFLTAGERKNEKGYFSVLKDSQSVADQWKTQLAEQDIALVRNLTSRSDLAGFFPNFFAGSD